MEPWLDAFVPAFGLIALGVALRRSLLREDAVWAGIERLVFWVLMPCLLTSAIASVRLGDLPIGGMAAALWGSLALGTGASLAIARTFGQGHAAATSVVQGGIRFNNLLGFAIAGAVFGPPGTALAAVTVGLIVPCVQVLVTLAFAAGGDGPRPRPRAVLAQMARNPLLLACALGFVLSVLGGLPPGAAPLARSLGQASVPLGLLAVGAALGAGAMRDRLPLQAATLAWKLLAMPALTLALGLLLGLEALPAAVAALFMAMPTATTSYVMARMMGGDAPLMAAVTTWQHVLAVATLPAWVLLLRALLPPG